MDEDNIHLCKCEVKLRNAEICVKFSSNSETSSENSKEFLEEGEDEIEQEQTLYSALTDLLNIVPPTREELIEALLKDEFCLGIRNYLLSKDNEKKKSNKPPNWMEKIGGYMLDSKESTDKDALLVYFNPTFDEELNDSGNGFKAVVPRSLIRRVMFACHGHPLSGHAGISKTIHRTKQIYYWPKMNRHIRVYVRSCQHCQQYKLNQAIYTDVHSHWPKYLNEFAFTSRTQVSEALGHTFMLLNTGREAPLPFDPRILYHEISLEKNKPEEYVKELLNVLKRAHQNMYHRMQKNYEKHKKLHNDKYHICEYELGDLVWRKTHILSDKDNNITKGLAIKRDGHGKSPKSMEEKSINTQDLLPYIPSYPIKEWEENQLVGTNTEHPNPNWMSEKDNIQKDIIIPSQPEIQVEQTNSSTPGVKTQGRYHKKHLKREAKRNGTYVSPVKPPDRRPRTRKPNRKYIDGFVTKVDLNNQSTTMIANEAQVTIRSNTVEFRLEKRKYFKKKIRPRKWCGVFSKFQPKQFQPKRTSNNRNTKWADIMERVDTFRNTRIGTRGYESTDSSSVTDSISSERAYRKCRSKKSASTEPRTPKKTVSTGTTPATSTEVTIPTATTSKQFDGTHSRFVVANYWRQQAQALLQQQQQPPPNGYYQQGFGQYSAFTGLQPLAQVQVAPRNQIQMEPVIESAPSVSSVEEPKEPMPEEAID
uniref:Integrase zinc-binding domain-containing protein n=1 Tax=Strigamia maritima TaxID=126957 RepID=T1IZ61_STRMM